MNVNVWVSEDHIWYDPATGYLGLLPFLWEQLGPIAHIHIMERNSILEKGQVFCTIESQKTVTEFESPLSGPIVALNPKLTDLTHWNSFPIPENWLIQTEQGLPTHHFQLLKKGGTL